MSGYNGPIQIRTFEQKQQIPTFEGALCAAEGLDPETWYADDLMLTKIALGYCRLCPFGPLGDDSCYEQCVIEERSNFFLAFGVRGGRTAAQRQDTLNLDKIRMGLEDDIDEP